MRLLMLVSLLVGVISASDLSHPLHPVRAARNQHQAIREFESILKPRDCDSCSLSEFCCGGSCCDSVDECTYDSDGNGYCVTCDSDEVICGLGCMPAGEGKECCSISHGSYCDEGEDCCGSSCCAAGVACEYWDGESVCANERGGGGAAPGRLLDGIASAGVAVLAVYLAVGL